jgi:hypothetical protein
MLKLIKVYSGRFLTFPLVFFILFFPSCTKNTGRISVENIAAYTANQNDNLISNHMPVFLVENDAKNYNLIGTPVAKNLEDGQEKVFVDPEKATVYTETREFSTLKNNYTNLIYRIHFQEIPGGFIPFHLGKGKNIGLIIVITLNEKNEPVLCTSVHTCGCYVAFVPTSYMSEQSFPDKWTKKRQDIYSESLPYILDFKDTESGQEKIFILIRDESHRVKDIWLSPLKTMDKYNVVNTEIKPLASLENLLVKDNLFTSFYETSGPRTGYVKESQKTRERLFMSWWAFDWRVGEDKILGKDKTHGIVFYTSLKPWAREKSDMRDFASFLNYWGWNL